MKRRSFLLGSVVAAGVVGLLAIGRSALPKRRAPDPLDIRCVCKPVRSARSSFIGREADISAIRERLSEHRLVTLTGVGGSGKTRLALQVGALELGHFADGVFFIDLAPVGDAELVSATMAGACGLSSGEGPGISGVSIDQRLIAALARRKSLLIVDNCEHLVEAVADLLDRILAECAEVSLLATSREALVRIPANVTAHSG